MPLSEHEQRLLDEMERNLYQSEGDHVTTVGAPSGRASFTAILMGILFGAVGVILLIVGVAVQLPILGVVGFAVLFGGTVFAIAPPMRFRVMSGSSASSTPSGKSTSFMDELGKRWDARGDGQDM